MVLALLLALATSVLTSCGRADPEPPRRNLVLVTIDTLRADRLGCYGYGRPTSPNLDRFSQQAVLFTNAFSTSSFTPPSHASLLTSQYVAEHGLLTWNPLADERLSLAEVLEARGYRTGASVNLGLLSQQNLGQGFEWTREGMRDGSAIVADGLQFLRSEDPRPFFLWLHLYDVHRPYGGPPQWRARFGQPSRPGVGDGEEYYGLRPEQVAELGLQPEDLRWIADRYDAGVAYADELLQPLLAELSTPRHLQQTLVIVTSDHGEALLEYPQRLFAHDPFLYPEVTRIPLIVRLPGAPARGRRSDALVSLIDVAPTALQVLGLQAPPSFRGISLLPVLAGAELPRDEIYMECWGWETLKAARSGDDFVVLDFGTKRAEYLDLRSASGAATTQPTTPGARRLLNALDRFIQNQGGVAEAPELSPAMQAELKRLGYL